MSWNVSMPWAVPVMLALGVSPFAAMAASKAEPSVEQGRYLVQIAGCNDCHTPGYTMREGDVPEAQWLLGEGFGWMGPWGTTYATNLRLSINKQTEEQWLRYAKELKTRPPMPWFSLNAMRDADLKSIYRFVRQLGPAGEPAPAGLPPGQQPPMPYASFPPPPPSK